MVLILDSIVVITAEGNGHSVAESLGDVLRTAGNQEAAISSIALVELAHGIFSRFDQGQQGGEARGG